MLSKFALEFDVNIPAHKLIIRKSLMSGLSSNIFVGFEGGQGLVAFFLE